MDHHKRVAEMARIPPSAISDSPDISFNPLLPDILLPPVPLPIVVSPIKEKQTRKGLMHNVLHEISCKNFYL